MTEDDITADSCSLAAGVSGVRGALAGRYQVRARLGRGATKEVYLAYDERLDREVALAIVVGAGGSAAARVRVAREAQVTGRLGDHPNVITVYDTGVVDGVPFLVLRAMRGGSLAELLERERPSLGHAVRLGRQIASALAHAHAHAVIHRDVKPDNVWLADDGAAALGDFGIAQQAGLDRLTSDGGFVGTVHYVSPEQIRGEVAGPASDLYALGVTLYELVTGRPPFPADEPSQVLMQHLTAAPAPPSQREPAVPPALERLILGLLAKDVAQRPGSAADVAEALLELEASISDRPLTPARGSAPPPPAGSPAPPRPDARRIVAVLAVRATVPDPEALHGVFDRCAAVIEHHGGSVERYLGDALIGLFGLTESHEDDPLRAARAAVELRATAANLRLGIESGEVFVGAGPRGAPIATGAAITAAGRLAEGAAPGEILLGDRIRPRLAAQATIDLARGRLLELPVAGPALLPLPETPFLGRTRELAELRAAFAQVRDERVCRLVTVAGPPGIGKSRLVGEFVAELGPGATVLAGRCPVYGEGTTYRALADIVRGLGGDPRRQIEALLADDDQAVHGILGAIGLSKEPAAAEETSWAFRRLLDRLGRAGALVVAVEDIHWAESALLDLLDHVAALSSGSQILLVCLTRPELLESRPAWAAPQPNRSVLVLGALTDAHTCELAERLGATELAPAIARRAEGNPLFVEQLVAVDVEQDDGELPASIQAVLSARIDRLDAGERMLLQHASVEGRTFHAGALAAGLPEHERPDVAVRLVALARKGLIGGDRPAFAGEDALRFTHVLIREAAYASVPKLVRAAIHASVAGWLEQRPAAADEIVGFHLEQACLLAVGIGHSGGRERLLAARAAVHFEAASRAALARGDPAGACALLERAIALVRSDQAAHCALLPALGAALFEAGRMTDAAAVLDEAIARGPNPRLEARARVEREFVRLETEATAETEHAQTVADSALPVLERESDDHGQSRAWCLRAQVAWLVGRVGGADAAWGEAAACARRSGDERELLDIVMRRASAAVFGPTPVDEAIRRCQEIRELVRRGPVAMAATMHALASLHAMRQEFEEAYRLLRAANETRQKLGDLGSSVSHHEALVEMLADQPARAARRLRSDVETLERIGDRGMLATTTAMLAQAVYAQGELVEAETLCWETERTAATDDIVTQVVWRGVQAKILADRGRLAEAKRLARQAVGLAASTDLLTHHGDAMIDLAHVLRVGVHPVAADRALRASRSLYMRKGNRVGAARATSLLTR